MHARFYEGLLQEDGSRADQVQAHLQSLHGGTSSPQPRESLAIQITFEPQPSLEIYAFHPLMNKWVEVGNSGMFRPEMLEPMGFPKDVHVHGWGIGLERPTMIR